MAHENRLQRTPTSAFTTKTRLIGVLLPLSLALCLTLNGCRYLGNRCHDMRDVFQVGVGLTTERADSELGVWPPALGAHAQLTDWINLGHLYFKGRTAEWDGRGFYAGPEMRKRSGFLMYQAIQIDQDYAKDGTENYFKKANSIWARRLNSKELRMFGVPAKELNYRYFAESKQEGTPLFHRGWHYWANSSIEVAFSDPLTHIGLDLRFGFDPSEVSDFILGIFAYDFKKDDLTREEWDDKHAVKKEE